MDFRIVNVHCDRHNRNYFFLDSAFGDCCKANGVFTFCVYKAGKKKIFSIQMISRGAINVAELRVETITEIAVHGTIPFDNILPTRQSYFRVFPRDIL